MAEIEISGIRIFQGLVVNISLERLSDKDIWFVFKKEESMSGKDIISLKFFDDGVEAEKYYEELI